MAPTHLSLLSSLSTLFLLSLSSAFSNPKPCSSNNSGLKINARLPPSLNPTVDTDPPKWISPSIDWLDGIWTVTYSSNPLYQALHNLQYTGFPILPSCGFGPHASPDKCAQGTFPGQRVDLTTFAIGNNSKIHSAFGYDTPRRANNHSVGRGWDMVYDFAGVTGAIGTNNSWEMLAWGYDEDGYGYWVPYETAVTSGGPAGLDIESRSPQGPSNGTFEAIKMALKGLGSEVLSGMVDGLVRIAVDGKIGREFVCGRACQMNTVEATGG